MEFDPKYLEWASDTQRAYYEAVREHGSCRKAAKLMGVHHSAVIRALERMKEKAARQGYAPDHGLNRPVPAGMTSRGVSQLVDDKTGEALQSWHKTKPEGQHPDDAYQLPDPKKVRRVATLTDSEGRITQQWRTEEPILQKREAWWKLFAQTLAEEIPKVAPIDAPHGVLSSDCLACYPVGDHHFGMLAWGEETLGDSYDLKIAEATLNTAFDYLSGATRGCETALVAFLGDLFHYDSMEAITPTSGNILDADSRFPKMVRAVIRSVRYAIERCLRQHQQVHVIIEIGNHDLSCSVMLMEALACMYEDNPRVTIDTSPAHYHYFRWGKNLIGTHHGHGRKLPDLPMIMAADRPQDWGETEHRCWWTGHVHQRQALDVQGVSVESFSVLAANDAWAAQKGYRSRRGMSALILNKDFGEVARHHVIPRMIQALHPELFE